MKKIAFKISTYISIFLVLPILKLFGKKYYDTNVVPKLLTVLCNTKPNHYQRKKVVPLATGDVVEIGVGPGLNLQYYNFEKVNKVIGIDPSGELYKIAKKKAAMLEAIVRELVTRTPSRRSKRYSSER